MTAMSVQAWPKDALELQPKRSSPSVSQTPSYWEERSTSTTADDEPSHHPDRALQVRVLMTKHQLLKHYHASTFPALHATSKIPKSLRAVIFLHT